MKNIFEHKDYISYLKAVLGQKNQRTGKRMAASKAMGCHTSFVSLVMQEKANLSLEQAFSLNEFLGHSEQESDYFLLLVQKRRAGSKGLAEHFEKQLKQIRDERTNIKKRLGTTKTISENDLTRICSTWIYGATHVLLSVPALQTPENLSEYLKLPLRKIKETLEYLVELELAVFEDGKYQMGPAHIHLEKNSFNITKHHANWRNQAMLSLDHFDEQDLHYSAITTLSKKDVAKIKDALISQLKENLGVIEKSSPEEPYVYCFDFFKLKR